MPILGRTWVFGRNVNTDLIFPKTWFRANYEPGEMASHLMSGIDESFAAKVRPGDILVADANFGCGSSREEAAASMREAGIAAVVAPSFGRLFTRNCINMGIPMVTCPDIHLHVAEGDRLEIDLEAGTLRNMDRDFSVRIPPVSAEALALIRDGGLRPYTRRLLDERRKLQLGH
jgi:3-isopropylmalate/(R)-2-methylmalate dehydratase small subunit